MPLPAVMVVQAVAGGRSTGRDDGAPVAIAAVSGGAATSGVGVYGARPRLRAVGWTTAASGHGPCNARGGRLLQTATEIRARVLRFAGPRRIVVVAVHARVGHRQ